MKGIESIASHFFCFSIYTLGSFGFWLICVFALCDQRAKREGEEKRKTKKHMKQHGKKIKS
jgi:hypothetical protein